MAVIKLKRNKLSEGKNKLKSELIYKRNKLKSETDKEKIKELIIDINLLEKSLNSDIDKTEDWKDMFAEGKKSEELFKNLCIKLNYDCVKTDTATDMRKHIDFYIIRGDNSIVSVDVKGRKRVDRRDKNGNYSNYNNSITWIEYKNTYGGKGWLYGEANIIAFQFSKGFYLVNRESLVEWADKIIENADWFKYPKNKLYKKYNRDKVYPKNKEKPNYKPNYELSMMINIDDMLENCIYSIWYFKD